MGSFKTFPVHRDSRHRLNPAAERRTALSPTRVGEPWVGRPRMDRSRGAAIDFVPKMNRIAAPWLQIIYWYLPKARRLALGLALSAASQLGALFGQSCYGKRDASK